MCREYASAEYLTLNQLKHIFRAAPVVADDAPVAQTEP
jgi:hypothetical protein